MNDGNPETGVTLRGVDRTYRIDCRSLNALARLEDETGLSLVAVLDAIREDDPPDLTLARQFLGAVLVDPPMASPEELAAILDDIGGMPVLRAAAAGI